MTVRHCVFVLPLSCSPDERAGKLAVRRFSATLFKTIFTKSGLLPPSFPRAPPISRPVSLLFALNWPRFSLLTFPSRCSHSIHPLLCLATHLLSELSLSPVSSSNGNFRPNTPIARSRFPYPQTFTILSRLFSAFLSYATHVCRLGSQTSWVVACFRWNCSSWSRVVLPHWRH